MKLVSSVLMALRPSSRDGGVDRLNTKYTVWALIVAAIVSAVMMWWMRGGITCWTPAQFTSAHTAYTNKVCLPPFGVGLFVLFPALASLLLHYCKHAPNTPSLL